MEPASEDERTARQIARGEKTFFLLGSPEESRLLPNWGMEDHSYVYVPKSCCPILKDVSERCVDDCGGVDGSYLE